MNKNKLSSFTIRGYKSISYDQPLTVELGDINIMLGANGAGKSNIISFFKMLGYMMSGSLQMFIAQSGTNQNFLYYGSKKTPALCAEIRFDSNNDYDIYRFSLANAVHNTLIINSEEIEWKNNSCISDPFKKQVVSDFKETGLLGQNSNKAVQVIRNILSSCKVFQFSDSSVSSPMRQTSIVDSAHYLQSEANNLASFLYFLKNNYNESYRRIVEYVRDVVPQFRDFYLEPERGYISLKWMDNSVNDYVFNADQFSDGSIRYIALATLLLQPEETMPKVIIIDEPELGLHPYAIGQLAEMVKDASMHAQVIIATQSPALVDNFSLDDVMIVERDDMEQCTTIKKLKEVDYKVWLDEYSNSDLWNKNVLGGRPV